MHGQLPPVSPDVTVRAVAAEVGRHRDAGATEVLFSGTDLAGEADRRQMWELLGEPAGRARRRRRGSFRASMTSGVLTRDETTQ